MEDYFLDVEQFPMKDREIQLTSMNSTGLNALIEAMNDDPSHLLKLNNLQVFIDKIDEEIEKYDHLKNAVGPAFFLLYLKNLGKIKTLMSKALVMKNTPKEKEQIVPKVQISEIIPLDLKDAQVAGKTLAKIRSRISDDRKELVKTNLCVIGQKETVHVKVLNEPVRIDIAGDYCPTIVEVSTYEERPKGPRVRPLMLPPHIEITVRDVEVFKEYIKIKDSLVEGYANDTIEELLKKIPNNKTNIGKALILLRTEIRLLNAYSTLDVQDFGWFTVRTYNHKPEVLWNWPMIIIDQRLSTDKGRLEVEGMNTPPLFLDPIEVFGRQFEIG